MDIRKKDNLTDAVEALESRRNDPPQEPPKQQQVVNNDGEIITLGQNGQTNSAKKPALPNKTKVVELSPEFIDALKKEIAPALESALDKAFAKFLNKNGTGSQK